MSELIYLDWLKPSQNLSQTLKSQIRWLMKYFMSLI